jgi:hypothetical protein
VGGERVHCIQHKVGSQQSQGGQESGAQSEFSGQGEGRQGASKGPAGPNHVCCAGQAVGSNTRPSGGQKSRPEQKEEARLSPFNLLLFRRSKHVKTLTDGARLGGLPKKSMTSFATGRSPEKRRLPVRSGLALGPRVVDHNVTPGAHYHIFRPKNNRESGPRTGLLGTLLTRPAGRAAVRVCPALRPPASACPRRYLPGHTS